MAPELGLFLDECFFEAYNAQAGAGEQKAVLGTGRWALWAWIVCAAAMVCARALRPPLRPRPAALCL